MNLINKVQCRELALQISKTSRAGKFNRVSAKFLRELDGVVKGMILSSVLSHPTVGKTITELRRGMQ